MLLRIVLLFVFLWLQCFTVFLLFWYLLVYFFVKLFEGCGYKCFIFVFFGIFFVRLLCFCWILILFNLLMTQTSFCNIMQTFYQNIAKFSTFQHCKNFLRLVFHSDLVMLTLLKRDLTCTIKKRDVLSLIFSWRLTSGINSHSQVVKISYIQYQIVLVFTIPYSLS